PVQPASNLIHRAATSQPSPSGSAAGSITGGGTFRVVLSLGAVLGLILLLYWASRRLMPRGAFAMTGSRAAVEVLARTAVSPRNKILLLRVGRRILVVGEGGQQLTTLCEITDPDETATLLGQIRGGEQSASKSFASLLDQATGRFRDASLRDG